MLNHLRSFALMLAALLAACGGGGDANTPSAGPNLTTEPSRAAWQKARSGLRRSPL